MRFLIDTNCWMQIIRDREHSQDVRELLAEIPDEQLFITDLSLHSVGIVLSRFKMLDQFPTFLLASGITTSIEVIGLAHNLLTAAVDCSKHFGLDFEDACQYTIAKSLNLRLVSLDSDFDRTESGRLTPASALQLFKDEQKSQNS